MGRVVRFAIATGRAERDFTTDLRGALAPVVGSNHPAITDPARVGQLLRSIEGYKGQPTTEYALKLFPYLFPRTIELRKARWPQFRLEGKEPLWKIPAEVMKMKDPHLVPLSKQVVALLEQLKGITGPDGLLFPSTKSAERPISENTINSALHGLGYKNEHSGHGFRTMASTLLNESGKWSADAIERQLAHDERDDVRAVYNHAQHLPERRRMMQWWADYLEKLKSK